MHNQLAKSFAAISILIVSAFASQASAQTYEHIDGLAVSIERKAGLIVNEAVHYRHTPEFAHVLSDAVNLRRLASHVHEVAHHHGSLAHLESDLAELDAAFHHMESVFDRIEYDAAHGYGHIHGNTSHVKRLLNSIEDDIHHLQEDIEILRGPSYCPSSRRVIRYSAPVPVCRTYVPYGGHGSHGHGGGYGGHGGGHGGVQFSIGGGSSRVTFRF